MSLQRGPEESAPSRRSAETGVGLGGHTTAMVGFRQEIHRGLMYIHSRLDSNAREALRALSAIHALVDLLGRKALITTEEVEAGKQAAARKLAEKSDEKTLEPVFVEWFQDVADKYAFEGGADVDCPSRVHLCHAACCRFGFALSKQDLEEGIVHWNLEAPYIIAQDPDGCCSHLDRNLRGCGVWRNRPVTCRAYDCRHDKRIWLDFEKMIPHPDLERPGWPKSVFKDHDHQSMKVDTP